MLFEYDLINLKRLKRQKQNNSMQNKTDGSICLNTILINLSKQKLLQNYKDESNYIYLITSIKESIACS